ncbi:MAG: hypothetical protein JXR30_00290 [Alphaproteobacteria bacterium]|nr:hypothetical protein [Alphaproteobacteria bacterium]
MKFLKQLSFFAACLIFAGNVSAQTRAVKGTASSASSRAVGSVSSGASVATSTEKKIVSKKKEVNLGSADAKLQECDAGYIIKSGKCEKNYCKAKKVIQIVDKKQSQTKKRSIAK